LAAWRISAPLMLREHLGAADAARDRRADQGQRQRRDHQHDQDLDQGETT